MCVFMCAGEGGGGGEGERHIEYHQDMLRDPFNLEDKEFVAAIFNGGAVLFHQLEVRDSKWLRLSQTTRWKRTNLLYIYSNTFDFITHRWLIDGRRRT